MRSRTASRKAFLAMAMIRGRDPVPLVCIVILVVGRPRAGRDNSNIRRLLRSFGGRFVEVFEDRGLGKKLGRRREVMILAGGVEGSHAAYLEQVVPAVGLAFIDRPGRR